MAVARPAHPSAVFELKSAVLTLVALVLKTPDLGTLARELEQRFGQDPGVFDQEPIVIDLSPVREAAEPLDVPVLLDLLRQFRMLPVAVRGGSTEQMATALAAGLSEAPEGLPISAPAPAPTREPPVLKEVIGETREAPAPPPGTLIIDRPLRSGQQVYARGADLVVMAVVSFGAEVIADGNIHVYAPLRGRAIAGARGNTGARIFTTCMEPQLVSIAGIYRTTETALPDDVWAKPAQVRLDGEKLLVEALKF